MEDRQTSRLNQGERGSNVPLESWKQIAADLQPDVRTAIRWERREGLPNLFHSGNELDSATDV